eukprot:642723-Rhodomonas_salina.3
MAAFACCPPLPANFRDRLVPFHRLVQSEPNSTQSFLWFVPDYAGGCSEFGSRQTLATSAVHCEIKHARRHVRHTAQRNRACLAWRVGHIKQRQQKHALADT